MKTRLVFLFFCLLAVLSASAENLVYNSSFECHASGWNGWGAVPNASYGNEAANADHVVTNATHGKYGFRCPSRLISRPFWATNGTYKFTFDAWENADTVVYAGVIPVWLVTASPSDILSLTGIDRMPSFAIGPTPTRFTSTVTVTTNGWHCVKFYSPAFIDAVQVERGSVATAYAPAPIEVGMDTADSGNNLFLSDPKILRFNFWNNGPQTNVTVRYDIVHGVWNTNVAYGTISTNALRAGTNTQINLTLPPLWGDLRVTCYITNVNASWDETSVAVFPYPEGVGRDTNGMLGIHAEYSPYHVRHARRVGFTWNRIFSPNTELRWPFVFPTLTTTNIYPPGTGHWLADYMFEYNLTNDLIPFVVLAGNDNTWYPQTNASLQVMIGDATNYAGRVVYRYKNYCKHWEIWNEPQQQPRGAINLNDPAIYAQVYTPMARLIKTIDPTAAVIAFGGLSQAGGGGGGVDFWNAFTQQAKDDADFFSFHFYEQHSGPFDPNTIEDYRSGTTWNYDNLYEAFRTNGLPARPRWNTENGVYDSGAYHTIAAAFEYPFYWSTKGPGEPNPWTSEAWKNEMEVRALPSMDRITYNFLRTVGSGFSQYNVQNGRMPDDTAYTLNFPSIYELNGTLKPWAVAVLIANHFVKTPGLGRATNSQSLYVEAWLHSNALGTVASIFCPDRTNRTMTLSGSEFPALHDTFGNLIQTNVNTIPITRSARYLVSGTLSVVQMSNMLRSASVAVTADTTPPGLTIDFSPIGNVQVWGGVTNAFKATAIDAQVMAYDFSTVTQQGQVVPGNQTNVMYRWSFNRGTNWSPWATTNHFFHSFAAAGEYDVSWQAKDRENNLSAMVTGPTFGSINVPAGGGGGSPAVSNVVNVGTANIGTISIAP